MSLHSRVLVVGLAMAAGMHAAAAQEPSSWRDPEQGCWYLVTAQGGIGLRYKRDGSPDCPEARTASTLNAAPARATLLPAATSVLSSAPSYSALRIGPLLEPAPQAGGETNLPAPADTRGPPLSWLGASPRPAAIAQPGGPQLASRAMTCWPDAHPGGASDRLIVQRVTVDRQAMSLVVEASAEGAARTERYSIDTNMDAWLGGRNQRDPRLGFVFTQSRGTLRLDWPEGGSIRAPVRSHSFRCQGEGGVT